MTHLLSNRWKVAAVVLLTVVCALVVVVVVGMLGPDDSDEGEITGAVPTTSTESSPQPLVTLAPSPTPSPTPSPSPIATPTPTVVPTPSPTPHSVQYAVEAVGSSVVQVQARQEGSGLIIGGDGIILTCAHVVEDSGVATVVLADYTVLQGPVVARESVADLALIMIPVSDLPTATIGNPSQLAVGDDVVVIGYPFGWTTDPTVSKGIVSAFGTYDQAQYVQFDAAVNPGSSGSPLVGLDGQVYGIVHSKFVDVWVEGMARAVAPKLLRSSVAYLLAQPESQDFSAVTTATTTYKDPPYGYSFEYPADWWVEYDGLDPSEVRVVNRSGRRPDAWFTVKECNYVLPTGSTLEDYARAHADSVSEECANDTSFALVRSYVTGHHGASACVVEYHCTIDGESWWINDLLVGGYRVSAAANIEVSDPYIPRMDEFEERAEVDAIQKSFRLPE